MSLKKDFELSNYIQKSAHEFIENVSQHLEHIMQLIHDEKYTMAVFELGAMHEGLRQKMDFFDTDLTEESEE